MSWMTALLPLLALGVLHPASTEPAEAEAIADDRFVATCVDLDADEIDTVDLCVVGLDGSVDVITGGLVPGRQVALSADRRLVAVSTADDSQSGSHASPVATSPSPTTSHRGTTAMSHRAEASPRHPTVRLSSRPRRATIVPR